MATGCDLVMDISVVIVNHDGGDDVIGCLRSVAAERPAAIVVVDNASSDGSEGAIAQTFPDVELIRSPVNVGFAAACNRGIRSTSTPYVFLMNPDATIAPGSLAALERTLDVLGGAGAVGALVLNPDGTVQPTKRAFPTIWQSVLHGLVGLVWSGNPGTRAYVLADASFDEATRVDWVAGTAMAIRRDAFDAVDGFDETFFFFVEDVDLCRRLHDEGYEVWFEPRAVVTHVWGGSWTRRPVRFLWMHQRNLFRYVRKHRRGAWMLAYPFIAAGLALRFLLLVIRWAITRRSVPRHRSLQKGSRS